MVLAFDLFDLAGVEIVLWKTSLFWCVELLISFSWGLLEWELNFLMVVLEREDVALVVEESFFSAGGVVEVMNLLLQDVALTFRLPY